MASYADTQNGCGALTVTQALQNFGRQNAAFSEYAWEVARQEGSTVNQFPTWPAKAFMPQSSREHVVIGLDGSHVEPAYATSLNERDLLAAETPQVAQPSAFGVALGDDPYAAPALRLADCVPTAAALVPPEFTEKKITEAATGITVAQDDDSAALENVQITAVPNMMLNTAKGILYDASHWQHLPVQGFSAKTKYILSRDSRAQYIALWIMFFAVVYVVFKVLFK